MCVEFVAVSHPCSERFLSGNSDFPLSSQIKPTFPYSNLIWKVSPGTCSASCTKHIDSEIKSFIFKLVNILFDFSKSGPYR